MAYKFQLGKGLASGSLAVAGDLSASLNVSGAVSHISASGELRGTGLQLKNVTGSAAFDSTSGDAFLYLSSQDGKAEGMTPDNFASILAGAGIDRDNATLKIVNDTNGGIDVDANAIAVDLNDLANASVDPAADLIAFIDEDGGNASVKQTVANFVAALDGNGISASAGLFGLDVNSLPSQNSVAPGADSLAFVDADNNNTFKVTIGNFVDSLAGAGTKDSSGQFELDVSTLTTVLTGSSLDGLAVFGVYDINETSQKKSTLADIATKMAGSGLTATNGVLAVGTVTGSGDSITATAIEDDDRLVAGINYFTGTISPGAGEIEVTLPAAPTVGDICWVKAPSNCGVNNRVEIDSQNGQTIDGVDSVVLNDPYASVGFVYIVSGSWAII